MIHIKHLTFNNDSCLHIFLTDGDYLMDAWAFDEEGEYLGHVSPKDFQDMEDPANEIKSKAYFCSGCFEHGFLQEI
jgi:hypothetical protein